LSGADAANWKLCKDEKVPTEVPLIMITLGIMGTLTQGTIILRICSRRKMASQLGIDDYLIIAAGGFIAFVQISGAVSKSRSAAENAPNKTLTLLFCIFSCSTFPLPDADSILDVIVFPLGKHIFNVDPKVVPVTLFLYWIDEIAYQITMTLVKSSILCFYVCTSIKVLTCGS
jgi:hypothetical protein